MSSSLQKRSAPPDLAAAEDSDASDDGSGSDPVVIEQEQSPREAAKDLPLGKIDRGLQNYVQFMASPIHQDQGLKLLQWTLWLASKAYGKETKAQSALQKLSFDLSFARYANRLLGLPFALEAARTNSWTIQSKKYPRLSKLVGKLLALSMIGYYPLEAGAYLHWMAPQWLARNRSAEKLSAWSCRCWLVYIVTEMTQCVMQWKEHSDEIEKACKDGQSSVALSQSLRRIQLQLIRNALFLLPCIHWSLPNWDRKPWLPANAVNGLMWLEAVTSLVQSMTTFSQRQSSK